MIKWLELQVEYICMFAATLQQILDSGQMVSYKGSCSLNGIFKFHNIH